MDLSWPALHLLQQIFAAICKTGAPTRCGPQQIDTNNKKIQPMLGSESCSATVLAFLTSLKAPVRGQKDKDLVQRCSFWELCSAANLFAAPPAEWAPKAKLLWLLQKAGRYQQSTRTGR